ncbi:ANTAR domain-containing protein [Arthrobacter sp. OY3WO11]|uniref:GAF and ANTAR domain-containing protein n=1 Tax=Arthrobacter sp. OY3WO11 TaxID=1835723 RepID=UPI0007CF0AD1|nr:ANTAR domain-containing protein [Arthrobacter sp. OY3WO11]OAE00452.1 antitermination regulator [Arthrobacter sp. OY3WO11]
MHAQNISSAFPARRARVLNGAGDEEAFETKASPPAVAGPLRAQKGAGHRPAQPGPAAPAPAGETGLADSGAPDALLLDLVSGTHSLRDSLDVLAAAAVRTIVRATGLRIECGVVVHQPKRSSAITGTSGDVVELLEWEQQAGEGPLHEVLAGHHPVAVLQRNGDFRWPRYSTQLQMAGFGSAMGIRLRVAPDADGDGSGPVDTPAALALFAQDAKAFPLQAIAEARGFAGLAAKSLEVAVSLHSARSTATDLRSALDSRTSINVACGVIMAQNRCSYHEAFAILAKASSHRNIKVRRVAEDILDKLPEGPPRAHFGS